MTHLNPVFYLQEISLPVIYSTDLNLTDVFSAFNTAGSLLYTSLIKKTFPLRSTPVVQYSK